MPYLIIREPGCVAYSISLSATLRAGRHEQNDLVLSDPRVSRHHIEITQRDEAFFVRDLGSTHGMLVNGQKRDSHPIGDGDRIQIGSALLTFRAATDPSLSMQAEPTAPTLKQPPEPSDRRLRLFYDISQCIGTVREGDEIITRLAGALIDILGCERAMIGLGQHTRDGLRKFTHGKNADDIIISRSILDAVLGRAERVVFLETPSKKAPPTMVREQIRAAICLPLIAGTRTFGFLYVDDRRDAHRLAREDVDFLNAVAQLISGVLDSAERLQKADIRSEALSAAASRYPLIGESPPMKRLFHEIQKCGAATGVHVLIHGESGTGKELVAHALHTASPRASLPLVPVNCAAIPETMIESELFGYVKGAFTGAVNDKKGKFVLADRSTLFLDEIGDLSLSAQAKVLRAIQEGEIQPLGSERLIRVNVRIIGATHKDLRKEIAAKRFREDLYYRLSTVELQVPPLREREGDVILLAQRLIASVGRSVGKRLEGITPRALSALGAYRWPGNVRELINELERAAIFTDTGQIDVFDLSARVKAGEAKEEVHRSMTLLDRYGAWEHSEKRLIEEALEQAGGNVSEAARLLGMTWIMMKRRMEKFGLVEKAGT